jgi:bacterioferritin-associated ferredoxin
MIVCQCQAISDHDIRAAVDWMRAADADTLITPGKVYRALGKRPDCGGCLSLFVETMYATGRCEIPLNLRGLRRAATTGPSYEGRQQGNQLSERSAAV